MRKQRQTRWQPPRGITLVQFPHRPSPYGVQWRIDGRRKTKTFPTAERQLEFARALAGDAKRNGVAAYRLDEQEAREWRAFRATIGEDADLRAVAACWQRHKPRATTGLLLADAVQAYTEAKRAEGVSEKSIAHYGPIFARLQDSLGNPDVALITADELARFMAEQGGESDETRRTRFARVRSLFNWLAETKRIEHSPMSGQRPPKVATTEAEFLTVEQARRLFHRNAEGAADQRRRELLGRLALEAFAGLRFDTAKQIVAGEIHSDGLRIPAAKLKTRQNQFLEGLPANLHAWLDWSKPEAWSMTERQYLAEKSLAFVRADVPHPRNCLRKSFASYHVAAFKDAPRTSLIMCHKSPKLLWDTYRGLATEAAGKAYFEIKPTV